MNRVTHLREIFRVSTLGSPGDCNLQGATFEPAKGGHIRVFLRGRRAIPPMHGSGREMKRGTIAAVKKQLGLE